jgi:hypothetical protein
MMSVNPYRTSDMRQDEATRQAEARNASRWEVWCDEGVPRGSRMVAGKLTLVEARDLACDMYARALDSPALEWRYEVIDGGV